LREYNIKTFLDTIISYTVSILIYLINIRKRKSTYL